MFTIAVKLLFSRERKFIESIIIGSFAIVLLLSSTNLILENQKIAGHWLNEIEKVDLWVYPKKPLSSSEIAQMGQIDGIELLSPFCEKSVLITLPNGVKQTAILLGVEELGIPRTVTQGKLQHLQIEKTIIADEMSIKSKLMYRYRGAKKSFKIGQYILVGENKMLLGGLCRLKNSNHQTPLLYTSYSNAIKFFELQSDDVMAYLVKVKSNSSVSKISEVLEKSFPVEVKLHQLVVAKQGVYQPKIQNAFSVWLQAVAGATLFLITLAHLFTSFAKDLSQHRQMGASFSFILTNTALMGTLFFVSSWFLALAISIGSELFFQKIVPVVWGYFTVVGLASLIATLGFIIKGSYASYRV